MKTGLFDKNGKEICEGNTVVQFKKGIKPSKRTIKPGEIWGFDPAVGVPDKEYREVVSVDTRWGTHPFNNDEAEYDADPNKWEIVN